MIAESRMKNDDVDSEILAKLLRNSWIQECYVPSKEIGEMTRIKNRKRFELNRLHLESDEEPFTIKGRAFLGSLKNDRIGSYLILLESLLREVNTLDKSLESYSSLQEIELLRIIPGVGLFSALLIYSEIGNIGGFKDSSNLVSYAGTASTVMQSSDITHYSSITR